MVKEELYINGENVELLGSLNPNLTFNIADIANPEKRKADFSKTITLPASKKINKIFEHIFDINTDLQTFNPNLKTDVVYLVNGEIQLDGYLQLKTIKNKNGLINYECIIIGRTGNFFNALSDKELTELDFTSLNHTYTRANQLATWNLPLTTDYVYPMIDYGFNQSNLSNIQEWNVEDFYPAIKVKKYLDEIFSDAGFTYTSTFLNSSYFNTLIIPFNSEEFKLTNTAINSKIFSANNPKFLDSSSTDSATFSGQYLSQNATTFQNDTIVNQTESFDVGGVYDNSTGVFTVNGNGTYSFSAMVQLVGKFTTPTASPTSGSLYFSRHAIYGYVRLNRYNSSNVFVGTLDEKAFGIIPNEPSGIAPNTTVTTASTPAIGGLGYLLFTDPGNTTNYIYTAGLMDDYNPPNKIFLNCDRRLLGNGEKIKIEIDYECRYIFTSVNDLPPTPYNDPARFWQDSANNWYEARANGFQLSVIDGYFNNSLINTNYSQGDTIDMNVAIPVKVKQKDFMTSLVKMFNLYISPDSDNDKNLIIEPRDDFYTTDVVNWSSKLDKSKDINYKPMGALNSNKYLYSYKKDNDYYNDLYFNTWGEVYGQREEDIVNDFNKKTNKTELIFSPTPSVGQSTHDRVIPSIYKFDEQDGIVRTNSNIRVLQWAGLKPTVNIWHHKNNVDSTNKTDYPYAGMYDDPYSATEDLGFSLTKEVYFANIFDNIITFNNNNLFNKYYKKFIEEITDPNSKIVEAYFYLNPTDIANLDFRKQYYFENQYFRLNKIENYNPINPVTKCEFLKIKEAQVFTNTTLTGNGGTGLVDRDPVPTFGNNNGTSTNGNNVSSNNSTGMILIGSNNYVSPTARGTNISGDNNNVYAGATNVIIQGSGNTVRSGLENVQLINSNNQTVKDSNVIYINDEIQGSGGFETKNTDFVASENIRTYLVDTQAGTVVARFSTSYQTSNGLPHVGKTWTFKKLHSSNQVTIDATAIPALIDGNSTHTLTSNNDSVTMMWDGQQFNII